MRAGKKSSGQHPLVIAATIAALWSAAPGLLAMLMASVCIPRIVRAMR